MKTTGINKYLLFGADGSFLIRNCKSEHLPQDSVGGFTP